MYLNNVCFLATDHNISKAYIHALAMEDLLPARIIYAQIDRDLSRMGRINRLKKKIKDGIKRLTGKNSSRVSAEYNLMLSAAEKEFRTYTRANGLYMGDYGQSMPAILRKMGLKYKSVLVSSINDDKLKACLLNDVTEPYVIFTGGGILKKGMFDTGKKFIHVHPGIVPDIKGSDCFLWGALVRKRIGLSAFFMNMGVDTGDIIKTAEYAVPGFRLNKAGKEFRHLPHILINFLDPSYRADVLLDLFRTKPDPASWEWSGQNNSEGKVYYFMHPEVAAKAAEKFLDPECLR